jgi:hypothetical protein
VAGRLRAPWEALQMQGMLCRRFELVFVDPPVNVAFAPSSCKLGNDGSHFIRSILGCTTADAMPTTTRQQQRGGAVPQTVR